ncbi:MAG: alpha-2-macroglobulin, partial [Variibacter sp.]|nr:alpha-2-macroglobulin [Variibacter sp.]
MFVLLRAAFCAALLVCCSGAFAADKAFHRGDLADAAIKLEAEIKREAGQVTKPAATLRSEAQSALDRRDARAALTAMSQLVAVQPNDAGDWLRLARTILQLTPKDEQEKTTLLERATTAAFIAYQRATSRGEEADALVPLSRAFAERRVHRPALDALRISLELREAADVRATYETLRAEHGFRLLDYSVDSDATAPRACFQFSEALPGKRFDLSPFVAVAGNDKPALSADDKQLCVEGLKHGERYAITMRAGLPSTVKEALAKSAEFNVYVRDRKPFVRFTGRAYVLPRTGQRGIPVVSVNTPKIDVQVFRVSDRNLLTTVQGSDFQRNIYRYELSRFAERSVRVWKGELAAESTLNADITTAFPVDQALGDLAPGVYAMVAEPNAPKSDEDYGAIATQWFIVSDLGLASFSGGDGVHVFVHSLASTEPKSGAEVRLISRSNEVLATRATDANGLARFDAALTRGEGGLSPAMVVATEEGRDYAFLNLKGPAFDLSDRGVAGRTTPTGLDAFVYAERGVYRTGETVHLTALLRDAQSKAAAATPLTLVVERPDGVEYRRTVVQDQGLGGRSLSLPLVASAPTGTWKVRAFVDPKGAALGQTTFLVEDYVPDRLEFDLKPARDSIAKNEPAEITLDGRYLYGAPASAL